MNNRMYGTHALTCTCKENLCIKCIKSHALGPNLCAENVFSGFYRFQKKKFLGALFGAGAHLGNFRAFGRGEKETKRKKRVSGNKKPVNPQKLAKRHLARSHRAGTCVGAHH